MKMNFDNFKHKNEYHRCSMWCKSGRTYVRHKIFRIDRPNSKLFFQKNRLLSNMMSKNQVNRRNIFTEKNALFLKSINNNELLI